jgi:flagellar FliL protein
MKRVLVIIAVVVVISLLIVVGVLWGKPLLARAKVLFGLEPKVVIGAPKDFTVNLLDPGLKRYLRIQMSFEYLEDKKLVQELSSRDPQIRDAIIEVLRAKTVTDFLAVDETNLLRQELMDVINGLLSSGEILDIYFVDLQIQ